MIDGTERLDALSDEQRELLALLMQEAGLDLEQAARPYVAPSTPTEIALAEIWRQIFDAEQVSIHDTFFELGGDSIRSIQVRALAEERGLHCSVEDIFTYQTIHALGAAIDQAQTAPAAAAAEPLLLLAPADRALIPAEVEDAYPLTRLQAGMIFHSELNAAGAIYHDIFSYYLQAPFDAAALEQALLRLSQRHAVLRTAFDLASFSEPVQLVYRQAAPPLTIEDWRQLAHDEQEAALGAWFAREKERGFALDRAPLIRFVVHRRSDSAFQWTLSFHHAILDGWSVAAMLTDLFKLYLALLGREPVEVPPPPAVAFRRFVELERQALHDAAAQEFWRARTADAAPTPLPRWPLAAPQAEVRIRQVPIDAALTAALQRVARALNVPIKSALLAAHMRVLGFVTGQAAVLTGVVAAGRPEEQDGDRALGLFLNTVPFQLELAGGSWADLIQASFLREQEQHPFQRFPLAEIQRQHGGQPLFESVFNFVHFHVYRQMLPFAAVQVLDSRVFEATNFALSTNFSLDPISGEMQLLLQYNAAELAEAQIAALVTYYLQALRAMAAAPAERYDRRSLLDSAESADLPAGADSAAASIIDRFARQARRTPDAAALIADGAALTYRELDERTNRLARHLRAAGVGPETAVGVCFERSPAAIVAILGILKAGGAYVPLDPRLPAERLAFIARDTAMPLVLTNPPWHALAADLGPAALCLEELGAALAAESAAPLAEIAAPDQLAYIIYTSGSTGQPKGVQITRRNLAASTTARLAYYRDRVTCFMLLSPFAFDSSVAGIFWTLCAGGALLLPQPGQEREPDQLARLIEQHGVSHLLCLPSLYALILAQAAPGSLAALRGVIAAGEPCPQRLAADHAAAVPGATLFNEYGPTEGTVWSTVQAADPLATAPTVPIGRPVPGVRVAILGPDGLPVPPMAPGELCIGGAGLARGYLNRPDLTAERFTPDPFGAAGSRLYRTGDLARYAPDGSIEFLGRIDQQIKIRGFRVELGEIEAVMRRHPAVAEAAVIAYAAEDAPRLVGYAVPRVGQTLDVAALRASLRSALAEYMLPQQVLILDALPLTPNGKLDRRALPAPDLGRADRDQPFVAPRTSEEMLLAGIWAEVLKLDQVGIHDDFFALGGHSLLAIQVISRIRQAVAADISVRHLFEAPTVAALAATIAAARADQPGRARPPLTAVSRDLPIAPSFAQEGLWFVHQLDPASSAYTIAYEVRLEGRLDVAALEATFNALVRRHESLRTTFALRDGRLAQVFSPSLAIPLPLIDLQPGDPAGREERARQLIDAETQRPFDLERGPLFRTTLLRLAPQEHIVLVMVHHIVFDAWSLGVLVQEAAELYQAATAGALTPPAPLPIQYADFAHWERSWLQPQVIQGELEYWKTKLAGAPPVLELPTDYPRPAVHSYHGTTQVFEVPAAVYHGLKRISREHGATLFMTVLAAFNTLLYRYSGQDDISVGTPSANRTHLEIENVIGFFINTLVLRTDLGGAPSFSELLRRVKDVVLEAQDHQHLPFNQLVEQIQPRRSPQYTPLFQVMFAFLQNIPTEARLPELHARFGKVKTGVAFDLTLNMEDTERGLLGEIEYNTDLFAGATISRMIGHLQVLLAAIAADPGQSIADLPLLEERERRRLLVEWNATSQPAPATTAHALFEAQAARTPEATALALGERAWSYVELNRRANRLAHALRRRGVGPDTLVGVCLERSLEAMAAILGVLKAGGAYVPLDPSYPQERLDYVLGDSGAAVLLTTADLAERWPGAPNVIRLDGDWDGGDPQDDHDPSPVAGPADLAYVIYTSGSTGRPKGVLTPHRAVANHTLAIARAYGITAGDRLLQLAALSFDVAVEECFPGWSQGAAIVMHAGGALAGVDELLGAIAAAEISVINIPSPYWHELVVRQAATRQALPPALRLVVIGSDAALTERLALWRELNGDRVTLINAYGPTETTITSTLLRIDGQLDQRQLGATLPIGRPIANTQAFVLDPRGQPAPIGVAGELHIAGLGLARGYLNRPDLTAERFVPAQFAAGPDRLYRTGDRARYRADGSLEYLGRIDEQVKIRGFRIEPGEIEAALNQHPAIEQSAVVARADAAGERRLIAYVVAGAEHGLAAPALRAYLGAQLPQYMIPAAFVFLAALPLTRHGKVDRRSLPEPDAAAETRETAYAAPRNAIEQIITGVCQRVLNVERLGIHDNFFDLGAHSLLLVRIHGELVTALQATAARPLTIVDLFKYPSISDLARYLSEEQPGRPDLDLSQQRGTNRAEALQRQKQLRQKRRGDTTPGKDS